jgi:DNA-binding response OmpR family regulator
MSQQVLVIDDDPDALEMIGLILQQRGFEPVLVQSGQAAFEFLSHDIPALIILDVMMPGMDGNEVCQQIRADSRTAQVPVVMLTARSATANQVEGLLAGADDYLVKPISSEELIASVQNALARAVQPPKQKTARVISVLGVRGGVGASTLAANLAVTLAGQMRTVLIDLEAGGAAALHLGASAQYGLDDLAACSPGYDRDSIEAALTPHPSGLKLLASARTALEAQPAGAILNHLRNAYDVCLLDLGAGLSELALALAPRSHVLLLALDADRATLTQAGQIIRELSETGSPWPEVKLVQINRPGVADPVAPSAIRFELGQEAFVIGPAPDAIYQSLVIGQPLVISQPDHPVVAQIRALATGLIKSA